MIILTAFGLSDVFAQVELQILDEEQGFLPAAHVVFNDPVSGKQQIALTDANGKVILPIKEITVQHPLPIRISFLGYHEVSDTLTSNETKKYLLKQNKVSLNNLVVTGEYSPNNPEKSVNRVRIIDRQQMDAMGAVNVADAIRYENNMRMGRDNILGSSTSVQGISGENVKIMIDGVPVIGRQDGNIDLGQLNLNNIDRIEIIQGPLSVNYGSNALAGTINLITKKGQEKPYQASLNSYYESVGQYNLDAGIGMSKGRHFMGMTAGRNFFDGWNPGDQGFQLPQSTLADTNRFLQWNPKEQLFASVQYKFTSKKWSVRPHADLFNEEITVRGLPRAPYYDKAFDQRYRTNRQVYGIDLSGDAGKWVQWKLIGAFNQYERIKRTVYKDLTTLEEELTANPEDQDTTKFQGYMSRGSLILGKENSQLRTELGYDLNVEEASGKRIENSLQSMGDYAVFASAEWQPKSYLLVKPGLRYSYNTSYQAPVVPALNIRYLIGPSTTLRFSYARGFRAPSLKELYFDFVDFNHNITGNENLKAESSDNFQLELGQRRAKGQILSKADVAIFYNRIHDLITLAQQGSSTSYAYINVGDYTTQGGQINLSHAVNHLHFSVGAGLTGRSNKFSDSSVATPMSYSPEYNARIQYEFKRLNGNIALFGKYNGSVQTFSINDEGQILNATVDAYTIVDLTATKYFFKKQLNWSFGVKNLMDVQQVNQSGASTGVHSGGTSGLSVAWGRTIFTSLKWNLSWK